MPERPPYYLTTPIYYVNARPHLGTAYSTIVTDTIARYKRAQGFDVFFLTGTDEHGQKIQRSAKAMNCSPQEFVDTVAAEFRALWDKLGLSYTDFIRTTEPRHQRGVQQLFILLKERGFIYKGFYTGQYCVSDEAWVDVGPGEPCPDCGRITETVTEENYFFKLSAFERKLLELYEQQPDFIRPESRRNEVLSFVRSGLRDLSISRPSFSWGIPFPGDEKHVIYVWMDALANYITALGWGSEDDSLYQRFWADDRLRPEGAPLHIIGKEISRFHCVYWPAVLMAAGLPLPRSIFAHGWLLFDQNKMSKSRGNVVRAETIHDVLGNDALRYFLLREVVFGQDGNFTFDALVQRYNADLANGYGNLVSRTLAMITRYFGGIVPSGSADANVRDAVETTIAAFHERMHDFDFSRALEAAWQFVGTVDGYITGSTPWKLGAKEDETSRQELGSILYTCAEAIRIITALVAPVLPDAAAKVWQQLGLGDIAQADLKNIAWGGLQPGTKLGEAAPLFPRAEKDAVTRMKEIEENRPQSALEQALASVPTVRVEPSTTAPLDKPAEKADTSAPEAGPKPIVGAPLNPPAPAGPASTTPGQITIDDFTKVELRVGQVKVAERVPKADKLLRLEVDLGTETRQILAGIAESYEPESLIGRKVIVVANLAPRKLRGLESNGMLLAGSIEGGKAVLASFLEDVPLGAKVK
ncbi:MAG TPA: methionine--tRNA ligase [Acidobacteriaceae bacterium]|nr:methionine--tRNA ligase [Acidobacteriaceae bacterium]